MEQKQHQAAATANHEHRELALAAKARSPKEAAELLAEHPAAVIATVLQDLTPALTQDIIAELPGGLVDGVMHAAPPEVVAQWRTNAQFAQGTIGRMMTPSRAVFLPDITVRDTIEQLRPLVRTAIITYGYVIDSAGKLLGIVTMRDLLFAEDHMPLESVMLHNAFYLKPELPLADAMRCGSYWAGTIRCTRCATITASCWGWFADRPCSKNRPSRSPHRSVAWSVSRRRNGWRRR